MDYVIECISCLIQAPERKILCININFLKMRQYCVGGIVIAHGVHNLFQHLFLDTSLMPIDLEFNSEILKQCP